MFQRGFAIQKGSSQQDNKDVRMREKQRQRAHWKMFAIIQLLIFVKLFDLTLRQI